MGLIQEKEFASWFVAPLPYRRWWHFCAAQAIASSFRTITTQQFCCSCKFEVYLSGWVEVSKDWIAHDFLLNGIKVPNALRSLQVFTKLHQLEGVFTQESEPYQEALQLQHWIVVPSWWLFLICLSVVCGHLPWMVYWKIKLLDTCAALHYRSNSSFIVLLSSEILIGVSHDEIHLLFSSSLPWVCGHQ